MSALAGASNAASASWQHFQVAYRPNNPMPRTTPSLALPLLLLVACAHQPPPPQHYGDVHEGPCRVDADCPQGERCSESRAHLWTSDGEIVGDLVKHRCQAPEPADASTGD